MVKKINQSAYRQIQRDQGLLRVEVFVREGDTELVREVAKHLKADDPLADKLRAAINRAAPAGQRLTFKEWLASADEEDSV